MAFVRFNPAFDIDFWYYSKILATTLRFHVCSHPCLVQPILVRFRHQKCPNIVMAWSWPKRWNEHLRLGSRGFGRIQSKTTWHFIATKSGGWLMGCCFAYNNEKERWCRCHFVFQGGFGFFCFKSVMLGICWNEWNDRNRLVSTSFSNLRTSKRAVDWSGE